MNDWNTVKVQFTKKQIQFMTEYTGIGDPQKAFDRFVRIMTEEGLPTNDVQKIINLIMERMGK